MDDSAPANGRGGALLAEDERLARYGHHVHVGEELRERDLARVEPVLKEEVQGRHDFRRPHVQSISRTVLHPSPGVGRGRDLDAQHARRPQVAGRGQLLTAGHVDVAGPGHVDGGPHADARGLDGPIVPVYPADPENLPPGEPLDLVADGYATGRNRAGDDRPVAGPGEDAVDRHAEGPGVRPRGAPQGKPREGYFKLLQASARRRGSPDDVASFEERPADEGAHVVLHEVRPGRVGQVALGERDQPPGEAEEAEDLQVLARLGHHAVVGRHHEQGQVQAGRPGQHVADELLVPGHVN